jgi:hypothetical protein
MSEIVSRKLELINESIHRCQTELDLLTANMNGGSQETPVRPAGVTEMIFITDKLVKTPKARDEDMPISKDSHCFVIGGKIWLVKFIEGRIQDVYVSYTDNWLVQAILHERNVDKLVEQRVRLENTTDMIIHTLKAGMATRLEYKSTELGRLIAQIDGINGFLEAPVTKSSEMEFTRAGGMITEKILSLGRTDE